jgi:hypothetical protein
MITCCSFERSNISFLRITRTNHWKKRKRLREVTPDSSLINSWHYTSAPNSFIWLHAGPQNIVTRAPRGYYSIYAIYLYLCKSKYPYIQKYLTLGIQNTFDIHMELQCLVIYLWTIIGTKAFVMLFLDAPKIRPIMNYRRQLTSSEAAVNSKLL